MAKQLEMFQNLTQEIPQQELEKLKQLAASSDQDNIDLCCTLLDMYNYTFTQKCVFVFEQQINSISLDEWIEAVASGESLVKKFKVESEFFTLMDAYQSINRELTLTLENASKSAGCWLYNYDNWIGNDEKDRPTAKVRAIQVKQFEKLLKYWLSWKQ